MYPVKCQVFVREDLQRRVTTWVIMAFIARIVPCGHKVQIIDIRTLSWSLGCEIQNQSADSGSAYRSEMQSATPLAKLLFSRTTTD